MLMSYQLSGGLAEFEYGQHVSDVYYGECWDHAVSMVWIDLCSSIYIAASFISLSLSLSLDDDDVGRWTMPRDRLVF